MIRLLREAIKKPTAGKGLKLYIQDMSTVENDIASSVSFEGGNASFWWAGSDGETDEETLAYNEFGDYYKLVIIYGDNYESTPEETKYWGEEELLEVNDLQLTADQLFKELVALPGADLKDFYGMRRLLDNEDSAKYKT